MSEPLWQPRTPLQARLLGLALGLVGWALLYWQVNLVLEEARAGAEKLTYSLTLILFGEMFLSLGALFLVRGQAGYEWMRSWRDNAKAKNILMVTAAVIGGGTWWLLQSQLEKLGYHTG